MIWVKAHEAKAFGCTHYGWSMGIIPGFVHPDKMIWVPRTGLLMPLDHLLIWAWVTMRRIRGEEPDLLMAIGDEIE